MAEEGRDPLVFPERGWVLNGTEQLLAAATGQSHRSESPASLLKVQPLQSHSSVFTTTAGQLVSLVAGIRTQGRGGHCEGLFLLMREQQRGGGGSLTGGLHLAETVPGLSLHGTVLNRRAVVLDRGCLSIKPNCKKTKNQLLSLCLSILPSCAATSDPAVYTQWE